MLRSATFFLAVLFAFSGCSPDADSPGDSTPEVAVADRKLPPVMAANAFYYYQDVEAAWGFYASVLGFETVADYGFAKILRVGPSSFLTLVDESQGMHSSQEPKSVTLAVITEEVEGWWEYLSAQGVQMRAPLGSGEDRPHDGFVAIDPEGYLLEFERFNEHPENVDLMPLLGAVEALYPDGSETAPGVVSTRPVELGVQGTVFWLYYDELEPIEDFYQRALGVERVVDQGWAKVYPASSTGFLGFVDGARGLHSATEEKAVTIAFFTLDLPAWMDHLRGVEGFEFRTPEISSEGDFAHTFVGYDPAGYFLEWDEFLDVPGNDRLLAVLGNDGR